MFVMIVVLGCILYLLLCFLIVALVVSFGAISLSFLAARRAARALTGRGM